MPGMQESLGISKDKLEIPSTVEITMDVKDFEMGNIVIYITPKLIEESDLSIFDDLDDVYAQVNELKSASTKLVSGSKELKEGTNTLNSGATELQKGITSARTGARTIETEVAKSIKIEYTNHEAHKVTVNGKKDTLYTPFVVGFGTIINNDKARNIKINSGKII